MTPYTLGPWIAPVLFAILAALAWLVLWLIEKGGPVRLALAVVILLAIVAAADPGLLL
ncbi:hypothetical protein AB7M49_007006 [Bradyrhizobium elkanii]